MSLSDPEIERIKQKKLAEMIEAQARPAPRQMAELNTASFDNTIRSDTPTLVDFWAEWCGPCRAMHPAFEAVSKEFPNIQFARLNVDAAQPIAARYSVSAIPTFVMFKSGNIVNRVTGAIGAPGMRAMCARVQ